jgi:hypothetical protein
MAPRLRGLALVPLIAWIAWIGGCSSDRAPDPRYRPAENILEVIAVLRRHVPDDTYRFEPARDFTGRNVYRSSMLRLESLERVHADALRAGHMDGAIAFAKGRALERLRAYDLAAEEYRIAADREASLKVEALRSADVCDALHRALGREEPPEPTPDAAPPDPEARLRAYEQRIAVFDQVARAAEGTHHVPLIEEEVERADLARAHWFATRRAVLPEGDLRAVSELQRVVVRHSESKRVNQHLLELADLYADLAVEYADANPPEGVRFDPVRFQELVDGASRLYEIVAGKDGTPEKLEAARRLEAFLAFALRIDHDRFTP